MCFSAFACLLYLNEAGFWALVAISLPIFSYLTLGVIRDCIVNLGQENKKTFGKREIWPMNFFLQSWKEG